VESPRTALRFEDVAREAGVEWIGRNGEEAGHFAMIESFGTGCATEDYDLDGHLDMFFAGGGRFGPNRELLPVPLGLFRRTGEWRFASVAPAAGLASIRHYHHGTWTADFDNDGFADLLLTGWGGLQLFRNQGDGTFLDVTEASGLVDELWSLAAAWGDLNEDGVLDLFVGHYVDWSFENHPVCVAPLDGRRDVCDPGRFEGLPCAVYLGTGDGRLREASAELGFDRIGKTLGVVIADLNRDGRSDVYVANDTLANHLYLSQPGGTFHESAIECGVALGETGIADGSMGVDVGDLDGDGLTDVWVANYENQTFALYRNLGHDVFTHASRASGVTAVGSGAVGFGTVLFDADRDGDLDIFCTNGHVWSGSSQRGRDQAPYLFENDGHGRMRNVAPEAGDYLRAAHLGRGVAVADLDGDFRPDLVVSHTLERAAVLRNETSTGNAIAVRLVGHDSPRSAVGAEVTVTVGERRWTGLVKGGGSYLSTSDRTLLIGLGNAKVADRVTVRWPSGQTSVVTDVASGTRLVMVETRGSPSATE
jgi:hypothetical protein